MDKTILCPTDFTPESLNLVKQAIQDHSGEKLNILLLHGIHNSDSITDLLYFSKGKIVATLTNPAFEKACQILQERFGEHLNSFRTELFSGFTQRAFNNLLGDLRVDLVYVPNSYQFQLPGKLSMDLTGYLDKCSADKVNVYWSAYNEPLKPDTVTQISPA